MRWVATADFESRSACPLKKTGSWKYSLDPTTEVLCLAFRLPYWDKGRVALWHPELCGIPEAGQRDLAELFEWILAGELVEAHNAWFERGLWTNICVPKFGWPMVESSKWRCSAAKSAAHSLPRSLDDACRALGLSIRKDASGSKVMMKMAKPRKPKKAEMSSLAGVLLYHESPELFQQLWAYCQQDVLAEEALSEALDDLSPAETEMYLLDQTINERGFQLDQEAVTVALDLIGSETRRLNAELVELTGGSPSKATQRVQMQEWFADQWFLLEDTQKATIETALLDTTITTPVRKGLELVQSLSKASTAKYEAMRHWAGPDWRVRGGLLYHGASTGRWSGSGPQPQNFPRGAIKDIEAAWATITTSDCDAIRAFKYDGKEPVGDVLKLLSQALRGAIIASPGKQLYVADYAAIEARVLLWLAGDEDALGFFRRGEDIYCDMASAIYDRPIVANPKKQPPERALGKVAVLGCLAADTKVLTPRGWVPLLFITKQDLVWDGETWVSHDGILDRGVKETLCLNAVHLTPDHLVRVGSRWFPANEVARNDKLNFRALATGSANLPFKDMFEEPVKALRGLWWRVCAGLRSMLSRKTTSVEGHLPDVTSARNKKRTIGEKSSGDTPTLSPKKVIGFASSTESAQSSDDARIRLTDTTLTTGVEVSGSTSLGLTAWKGVVSFWRIWSRWMVGTIRPWNWIERTIIWDISRTISDSLLEKLTWGTADGFESYNNTFSTWRPVYDIANAGPNQQFTIQTSCGPLLVHNCGYQMGAPKFHATCAHFGIDISEDLAQTTVSAYREKYWRVKQLWYDQEAAAIKAVNTKCPQPCGRVTWKVDGRFLYATLPSGRRLAYPEPRIKAVTTSWGATKVALTYMGVNPVTRKWQRQSVYGGLLVENLTQSVSRDLLAEAMLRCEQSKVYLPVLSVHDEIICETSRYLGSVKEFGALVAEVPVWAEGLPVETEAWSGRRYRK